MDAYIKREWIKPNLPDKKVKKLFVSHLTDPVILKELARLETEPVFLAPSVNLRSELRYHPDILVINAGNGVWLTENGNEQTFDFCKFIKIEKSLSDVYPGDCLFNMVYIGNLLICSKNTDIYVYGDYLKNIKKIIRVRQGYAKCSTAALDCESFITSDCSIYDALKTNNFNVLKVTNNGIALNGYNTGFFGGCCGKIDKNLLAFTGKIESHEDYTNIKAFCNNVGVDIISLSDKPLYDYGGLLPATQNAD